MMFWVHCLLPIVGILQALYCFRVSVLAVPSALHMVAARLSIWGTCYLLREAFPYLPPKGTLQVTLALYSTVLSWVTSIWTLTFCWLSPNPAPSIPAPPPRVEYKLHENSTLPVLLTLCLQYLEWLSDWTHNRFWVIFVELVNRQMRNKNTGEKSAPDRWAQSWHSLNVSFDQ